MIGAEAETLSTAVMRNFFNIILVLFFLSFSNIQLLPQGQPNPNQSYFIESTHTVLSICLLTGISLSSFGVNIMEEEKRL